MADGAVPAVAAGGTHLAGPTRATTPLAVLLRAAARARRRLSQPAPPRVFSMQKIVEITYYNMSRIRIVWSRIWAILGQHFQSVALRKDEQLSMYAIDAMRQLAFKFLEKEELTSFHFQRDFLKPFDHIIANAPVGVPVTTLLENNPQLQALQSWSMETAAELRELRATAARSLTPPPGMQSSGALDGLLAAATEPSRAVRAA
jgi:hypothetical protein